eukprot:scaffold9923_cov20-Cyclotella_meneghiniana.AAC.1
MFDFAIFAVWERVLFAGGWLGQLMGALWAARKRLCFAFCAAARVILLCLTCELTIVGVTWAVAVVVTCTLGGCWLLDLGGTLGSRWLVDSGCTLGTGVSLSSLASALSTSCWSSCRCMSFLSPLRPFMFMAALQFAIARMSLSKGVTSGFVISCGLGTVQAEIVGVAFDCRRRLRVISVCGKSLSHRLGGKLSAVPANTLRKCALKLRIATSAALRRWHPGGTNSRDLVVQNMFLRLYTSAL